MTHGSKKRKRRIKMIIESWKLWRPKEYTYPAAYGFIPNIVAYLHDENESLRPCIVVVPGGGYCVVSPTEGEIVAKAFYEKGYNAFVCTYTTNLLMTTPLKKQPISDLSRAIRLIRKNADKFHINLKQVVVCGFSAGAHLSGSLCVHYEDVIDNDVEYAHISNRPDAVILSYPVITAGSKAHRDSFVALLGADASSEELEYFSLEKQVTAEMPPCFIWHTATDEAVPVENSYLFAQACMEQKVTFAHHVFSSGRHGLSLANKLWASGNFGKPYTMEQAFHTIAYMKEKKMAIPQELENIFLLASESEGDNKEIGEPLEPNNEVAVWIDVVERWLKTVNC